HGRIGPRIRDKPGHRLHDERIAQDEAHALRVSVDSGFGEHRTMVKPHELHKADLADAVMNYFLHFLIGRGRGHTGSELSHIGSADLRSHGRDNGVKGLLRDDAPPSTAEFARLHYSCPPPYVPLR